MSDIRSRSVKEITAHVKAQWFPALKFADPVKEALYGEYRRGKTIYDPVVAKEFEDRLKAELGGHKNNSLASNSKTGAACLAIDPANEGKTE
jgi:hypothetical protein